MDRSARRRWFVATGVLLVVVAAGIAMTRPGGAPDVPTRAVTKGEFVDYVQIRGDIRPARSVVLSAPMQSGGDLQIVRLVKNGAVVHAGDIVVEFDGTALRQRLAERSSELKQAEGEIAQARAQMKITVEQSQTAVMKATYDVERAKLDLNKRDLVSRIEFEQAKLTLADAEQRLTEERTKAKSTRAAAEADLAGKERKRDKARFDVERTQHSLDALQLKAPADGVVNILENPRSGGRFGDGVEFREGDRVWSGANILELPDLSSIHLEARLDESDRGRLGVGQTATVRIEAVPGKDFEATVDLISVLARVDFSSGWPPQRNFDLGLVLRERDPRIRPGMSATARIAVDRLPGVLLVPVDAIFQHDGLSVVYRLNGSHFDERRISIVRRGREQAAVGDGIAAGDRIATSRPDAALIRRQG